LLLLLLHENKSFAFTHNSELSFFSCVSLFSILRSLIAQLSAFIPFIALALARCGNQSFSAFSMYVGCDVCFGWLINFTFI